MSRFASHYTVCSGEQILKKMIIEQNNQKEIIEIFSMNEGRVEAANTMFYNGVFSSEIISFKQTLSHAKLIDLNNHFQYIDISEIDSAIIPQIDKLLILDFGTTNTVDINTLIGKQFIYLQNISIFDIIAACTYNPALVLNVQSTIKVGNKANILLWENVDLINKTITDKTRIKSLNP